MKLFNLFNRKPRQIIILNENDILNHLNKQIGKKITEKNVDEWENNLNIVFGKNTSFEIDNNNLDDEEEQAGMNCYTGAYDNDEMLIDFFVYVSKEGKILFNEIVRHY